jgi:hypothetical protein
MSDQLTFSWFVGTCNLGHPATGPQLALWNTVKYLLAAAHAVQPPRQTIREPSDLNGPYLGSPPWFCLWPLLT